MVKSAMIDFAGNPLPGDDGMPLSQILAPVRGKKSDFLIYMWAKRAVAMWNDPNGARNPGLSEADAIGIIAKLETPVFQQTATAVSRWNDLVLDYASAASDDYKAVVDRIRRVDPGFYIPLFREFEAFDQATKGIDDALEIPVSLSHASDQTVEVAWSPLSIGAPGFANADVIVSTLANLDQGAFDRLLSGSPR